VESAVLPQVPSFLLLPFVTLLAAIALGPLWFSGWWGRHYTKVAVGLAAAVCTYYFVVLQRPIRVFNTAYEYLSFIALVSSLFVVSGGIHIRVKGEATPWANVIFLLIGAVAANVLGTTGASMLLIRPWLRMNKYRVTGHHVVFFIFIVSNVGGSLTPVGDPPLFLGYLMGVPFWWTTRNCLPMWCVGVGVLLAMFYFVDEKNYLRAPAPIREKETAHESWRVDGLSNLFFLAIILLATTINHPRFVREVLMLSCALGSWFTTPRAVHESNHFSWAPVKEVTILFIGIFGTMIPALDWLEANAAKVQDPNPGLFFFGSGALSSVLDNAPTYLCFLKAAIGRFVDPNAVAQFKATHHGLTTVQIQVAYLLGDVKLRGYLLAISIGSVFFGANTYIGNGPNFMVKAIADHQKVHTPTFLDYFIRYTVPFMMPMVIIVWVLFFRG
jgi:Na+/H+ antiporter NhaD/arsenite permease-like protein